MDGLEPKIEELEQKMDKLQKSIDRMNKIFLWTLILGIAFIVIPLIGLAFVLPSFMNNYVNTLQLP
ncbi:MAG: hypothetical protein ABR875_01240 [Minisyncoccia bacterium]